MQPTRHLVLLLLLGLIVPSCAHAPRSMNESPSVSQLRQDYLKKYPDGPFNLYIKQGQVVKGMKFVEVTASWGLPETRKLSRDRQLEFWTYFGEDNISGDWTRFTLIFEKNQLMEWDVNKHFVKNGTLDEWVSRHRDPRMYDCVRVPVPDASPLKR